MTPWKSSTDIAAAAAQRAARHFQLDTVLAVVVMRRSITERFACH
jgi:hypothetical protein